LEVSLKGMSVSPDRVQIGFNEGIKALVDSSREWGSIVDLVLKYGMCSGETFVEVRAGSRPEEMLLATLHSRHASRPKQFVLERRKHPVWVPVQG
jgi:hypothetical protein